MDSIRSMLRAASDPAHRQVDALFGGGLPSIASYQAYLLGMERLLRASRVALAAVPLDPALAAFRDDLAERGRRIAADLASLGIAPSPAHDSLGIPGHGEAIGVLYVLEGSALGARGLARDAARLGFDAGHGAAFLQHHAGDAGRWRRFVHELDALPSTLLPSLRAGALAAFAVAAEAFSSHLGGTDAHHPQ